MEGLTVVAQVEPLAKPDLRTLPWWAGWRGDQRLMLLLWTGSPCCGCGVNIHTIHEYFTVPDHVWAAAGWCPSALSCIGCMEKGLGREMTSADFTAAPCNRLAEFNGIPIRRSDRFNDRLSRNTTAPIWATRKHLVAPAA